MRPAKTLPTFLNDIAFVKAIDGQEDDGEVNEQQYEADKRPF